MKEYKGLYHNVEEKRKFYEYGAHFKYSELYYALKNLKLKQKNESSPFGENNNSSLENDNKEEFSKEKKRKKYKLKTLNMEENNRYLITDVEQKKNEGNELNIIEEEEGNERHSKKRKNRFITRSLDKIHLPKISSNNLISLENDRLKTESNETINIYQSLEFNKKRKMNFPKINFLLKNDILPEITNKNKIVDTQNIFEDKDDIKAKNKAISKIFLLNKDKEERVELLPRTSRKNNRFQSIFEKEKIIKGNNLFLGEKNNYDYKDKRDIMNDRISQQIHYLRKQLLGEK